MLRRNGLAKAFCVDPHGDDQRETQGPRRVPRDRTLFAALIKSLKADLIVVSVSPGRLNDPGSPVWDPGENLAPLLGLFTVVFALIFVVNLIAGVTATVLCALLYVVFVRPWILDRVSKRAREAALMNLPNWELLWKKGGLIVALKGASRARCVAPSGDWRAFVHRHLPPAFDIDSRLHAEFAHSNQDEGEAFTTTEVHRDGASGASAQVPALDAESDERDGT